MATSAPYFVSVGEVLWDSMPSGLFPGGAAMNIGYDLNVLGRRCVIVSRVGNDFLGEDIRSRLERMGLPTEGLQVDEKLPTGFVRVQLAPGGIPSFQIVENVAWDNIQATDEYLRLVREAHVVIFGTLAQRAVVSRRTIRAAWDSVGLKCCDVNLRPPFDDRTIVLESMEAAEIVKLNHEELERISTWAGIREASERRCMETLASRFKIDVLCVTRGANGAALLRDGEYASHPGFRVEIGDTVGAGDAFLAGLLDSLLLGLPTEEALSWANLCGAHVASKIGGTPPMDRASVVAFGRTIEVSA